MSLTEKEIQIAFKKFICLRNPDHRYASFDYCYNYFHQFTNKKDLVLKENLEKSCLHLGFYLSSWGMYRGSSFLLQKSLTFYIPIIKWLAFECPSNVWNIDVNNYNEENIDILIATYNKICDFIPNENRKIVLATKIMLGIFANTPAFDEYFTQTFKFIFNNNPAFKSFNKKALQSIYQFYRSNNLLIDNLSSNCFTYDFNRNHHTKLLYTKAKVIDMIGFGYSFDREKDIHKTKPNKNK